jgi:hypothetical protein
LGDRRRIDGRVVVDHEDAVSRAPDVKFDPVDAERDRSAK